MQEKLGSLLTSVQDLYTWLTEGSQRGAATLSKILLAVTVVLGLVTYNIGLRYFEMVDDARAAIHLKEEADAKMTQLVFENEQLEIKNKGLRETIEGLIKNHPPQPHDPTYEEPKPHIPVDVKSVHDMDEESKHRRLVEIINS